jgi:hypothetical protein
LLKLLLVFAKIVIITLFFEKNANFFAENWQNPQKIVIITSTPSHPESIQEPASENFQVMNRFFSMLEIRLQRPQVMDSARRRPFFISTSSDLQF